MQNAAGTKRLMLRITSCKLSDVMTIMRAEAKDAPLIGEAIVAAVGENVVRAFAGAKYADDVKTLFARLAAREDTQYSYLNTLKAVNEDGNVMGVIVGYDGAELHRLRKPFIEEAEALLDRDLKGNIGEECLPDEFYLDSMAVFPEFRRQGVARALMCAMIECASRNNKPLGLLCSKHNDKARKLYESLGFRQVGETFFGGELMDHMQRS